MAADGIRTHYKLWDGSKWVKYWFTTSADAIHEVTDRRFVTDIQKDLLDLGTNVANGLLKLNASKKVDITLLPDLSGTYALVGHNHDSVYAPINHNHSGTYAPVVHDHDTVYSKLDHNHSGIYEPVFTKKTAFNKDFGGTGTAITVSRSDHDHSGIYEPVITKNSAFNLNKASKTQAEAGAVDTVLMTPLRTKEAIEKLAPAPPDATESIKGIVKLSSDFNPTTADANTALSQAGAKALKAYADIVAGMGFRPQDPCQYAIVGTDADGYTLSGTLSGTVQIGDRVLVSGRTNKAENGIYIVNSGDWTKDPESVKSGATTFILKGLSSGTNDTIWWYNPERQEYVLYARMDVAQESTDIRISMQESSYQLFIKNDAIQTHHVEDGQITEAKLATDAVTTNKIKDGNVTDVKLADNAVTTDKINDGAVTAGKLGTGSVTTIKIKDGNVTSAKLGANAVTEDKIKDGAVTEDKIEDLAISNDKIANKTITGAKIADYTISGIKIIHGSIVESHINSDAVTSYKIKDEAVTEAKLAAGAVSTYKLANGAVTTEKLGAEAVSVNNLNGDVKELIKKITVGTTTPSNPNVGDVWLDTSDS